MKVRFMVSSALLLAFLLTGCESPTSPLNEEGLADVQSLASDMTETTDEVLLSKGGNAGLSTEMNQLLAQIRSASAAFHRVEVAEEAGYASTVECASNPFGPGAMGVHYVNGALLAGAEAGTFDPLRPEVLVYEPQENGRMRLVAVEYLIFKDAWVAAGNDVEDLPTLLGEEFVTSFGPEAHGLPDHYELHVWLWRNNPDGMFAQWNPKVTCPA